MNLQNKINKTIPFGLAAFLGLSLSGGLSYSVPIAVIDSGTDFKHSALLKHTWTNPGNLPGDEFENDKHGWNFAEKNNETIDYSFLGKFSPDTSKFFEIQLKILNGTATEEDKKWIQEKRKDAKFIEELQTFGNFVHGTHVAGIASSGADQARVMAAKIIPTQIKKPPMPGGRAPSLFGSFNPFSGTPDQPAPGPASGGPLDDLIMQGILGFIAGQQAGMLEPVGKYVNVTGMAVANCSFGTSATQAKMIVAMLAKNLLKRDLTDAEAQKYALYFIGQVLEKGKTFATSAEKTLFVIAAGNDGADNDRFPTFPSNLKLDNTISVAATRGYDRIASFSSYGKTTVELAAPGVGIRSSIPTPSEDEFMIMSGTSQAAPFVANVSGRIMDENPKLTLAQVKKILMETVDKKDFLAGKVIAGGIANAERAILAAQLSLTQTVEEAIESAKGRVKDVGTNENPFGMVYGMDGGIDETDSGDDGAPVALPSLFQVVE